MSTATEPVSSALRQLADTWEDEAIRRKKITPTDLAVAVLDYCAAELRVTLKEALEAGKYLTVDQYARKQDVTTTTVRKWIRRGWVAAEQTGHGYRIAATAQPLRRAS